MDSSKPSLSESHAYRSEVKNTFKEDAGKYQQFCNLMTERHRGTVKPAELIPKIKRLFRGHRALLQGFKRFVPTDFDATLLDEAPVEYNRLIHYSSKLRARFQANKDMSKTILKILSMYADGNKSKSDVHQEVAHVFIAQFDAFDLLEEFFYRSDCIFGVIHWVDVDIEDSIHAPPEWVGDGAQDSGISRQPSLQCLKVAVEVLPAFAEVEPKTMETLQVTTENKKKRESSELQERHKAMNVREKESKDLAGSSRRSGSLKRSEDKSRDTVIRMKIWKNCQPDSEENKRTSRKRLRPYCRRLPESDESSQEIEDSPSYENHLSMLDMVIETMAGTVNSVTKLLEFVARHSELKRHISTPVLARHLSAINMTCIRSIYGDNESVFIDSLWDNPTKGLPVMLDRLKQKHQEWSLSRGAANFINFVNVLGSNARA